MATSVLEVGLVEVVALFGGIMRIVEAGAEAGRHGRFETGSVWCRLGAELSEVEIGAGFVADVH